ncbi:MAG: hypothetical protein ACO1OQ_14355 [Rufibacter sp.]
MQLLINSFIVLPVTAQTTNALWSKTGKTLTTSNAHYNYAHATAKDEAGNVYVAGTFQGATRFETVQLQSEGAQNAFFAKYSPQGSLLWVKTIAGTGVTEDLDIAVDATAIYVTGLFRGAVNFNPEGTPVTLTGPDVNSPAGFSASGFVAKYYVDDQELAWVKPIYGTLAGNGVYNLRVALSHGEIFLAGAFFGELDFNAGNTQVVRTSSGSSDGFLMEIQTHDGGTHWWRGVGGINGEAISALAVNDNGLFVAGVFNAQVDFNRGGLQPEVISSLGGNRNIFLAGYHRNTGEFDWLEANSGYLFPIMGECLGIG